MIIPFQKRAKNGWQKNFIYTSFLGTAVDVWISSSRFFSISFRRAMIFFMCERKKGKLRHRGIVFLSVHTINHIGEKSSNRNAFLSQSKREIYFLSRKKGKKESRGREKRTILGFNTSHV